MISSSWKLNLFCLNLVALNFTSAWSAAFDEVSSLHVWITISSLANKDPNNMKALLFRQVELNWINAPLRSENDYIGLYLDSQPDENVLPVSVYRLEGQVSGQILSDYYLPQIDFYNETSELVDQLSAVFYNSKPKFGFRETVDEERMHRHHSQVYDVNNNRLKYAKSILTDECVGYCLAYHSGNRILAKNCLKTNPNWMQDSFKYIGSKSMTSIMIPGSHNSATYSRELDKTVLHMIDKYQLNQDESIFNQLIFGIRHLDLRVGYSKVKQRTETLWIYHDIFRTDISLNEVLGQNENIATQQDRHAKLIDLIFKQLGQYIVPSHMAIHTPIEEYVKAGKRVIVGYANRHIIIGSQTDPQSMFSDRFRMKQQDTTNQSNITSNKNQSNPEQPERRVGLRIFNRLKSLKSISNTMVKSTTLPPSLKFVYSVDDIDMELMGNSHEGSSLAKVAMFFPSVRHLWPNKDTIEGLAQYMNETTCRKYFGELRSMMAELTPTVFGAIADKYDGNRKLAQLVNRHVTDWVRDRWLHCINIIATDYFLGNDLIRLSIYANKMRVLHRDVDLNSYGRCRSFRRVEHLLDKSKIPIQFTYHHSMDFLSYPNALASFRGTNDNDIITHTSSDGNQILLKPLKTKFISQHIPYDRRESFVDNVSDGFTNLVSSVKRLLNL